MLITQDEAVAHAVANLRRRSERQEDGEKLRSSFVDVGVLLQLRNFDNQIIFGRRGTGKTHILRLLASEPWEPETAVCYIDFRTLGSTAQFTDGKLPIQRRCTALFRDILAYIHDTLLEHVVGRSGSTSSEAVALLDTLAEAVTASVRSYFDTTITTRQARTDKDESKLTLTAAGTPRVDVSLGDSHSTELERTTASQVTNEDKIIFPAINSLVVSLLRAERLRLLLLLDEWSSLPWELQPFLAEFTKRSFLASPAISVKIASLSYRSNFTRTEGRERIGFELGSDISATIDLDDYYVLEKDPDTVANAFAELMFRHLKNELPYGFLEAKYQIRDGRSVAGSLLEGSYALSALIRASQGIPREPDELVCWGFFPCIAQGAIASRCRGHSRGHSEIF